MKLLIYCIISLNIYQGSATICKRYSEKPNYEQIALNYILDSILVTDKAFKGLKFTVMGKTSDRCTPYNEFFDYWDLFKTDTHFRKLANESFDSIYCHSALREKPVVSLDVSKPYTKKRIFRRIFRKNKLLNIGSVNNHVFYKGKVYLSVGTRYYHDTQGFLIKLCLNEEGMLIAYSLSRWIA